MGSVAELPDHIADAMALLDHIAADARLLDVGSGAGLPGIIIAIARPDVRVTALEPVHKKHAFLRTAKRELDLENFVPLAERDEQHIARPDLDRYDVAVSRATFPLEEWLERATNLVVPGGRILGLEGEARTDLPPGASRHPYEVGARSRNVIVLDTLDS